MDLAAFAFSLWSAVQFYFLSNLRKKINIVINKHNILIDCLHKLAFALSRGVLIGCRKSMIAALITALLNNCNALSYQCSTALF